MLELDVANALSSSSPTPFFVASLVFDAIVIDQTK